MNAQRWASRHPVLLGFAWLLGSVALFLVFARLQGLPIDLLLAGTSPNGTATLKLVLALVGAALLFGFGMKFFIDYVQPRLPSGRLANVVGFVIAAAIGLFVFLR